MKVSRPLLKTAIAVIFWCFNSAFAIAQTDTAYRYLPDAKQHTPFYVVNDNIITSGLNFVNPIDIDNIYVWKDKAQIPPRLSNLVKDGIIMIKLKKDIKVKTRSFKEIKEWLDIKEDVKFAVDGFYVSDTSFVVATASICQVDVIKKQLQTTWVPEAINIWTLVPAARKGSPHGAPHSTDKPGEIYIR